MFCCLMHVPLPSGCFVAFRYTGGTLDTVVARLCTEDGYPARQKRMLKNMIEKDCSES